MATVGWMSCGGDLVIGDAMFSEESSGLRIPVLQSAIGFRHRERSLVGKKADGNGAFAGSKPRRA
jgi:hypothetical protein